MRYTLRLTGKQYTVLRAHLLRSDGLEAVAFAFCGRHTSQNVTILTVSQLMLIHDTSCTERTAVSVKYRTDDLADRLEGVEKGKQSILKIHSHPDGSARFSKLDDASDEELFSSMFARLEGVPLHASAIMLPNGELFGRAIFPSGEHARIERVSVVGDDIRILDRSSSLRQITPFDQRNAQAFGAQTTSMLHDLTVGVVGCSGTGSIVVEQLARLGVGKFVLVDPDVVEEKNLNRIVNSSEADALAETPKVDVMRRAIGAFQPRTEIETYKSDCFASSARSALARCDVIFGCVDTVDGRHLLNLIAAHYVIPYFDVGVRLDADGTGGISHITGSSHYVQADGSSLMSRGVYTADQLGSASLFRKDPAQYAQLKKEKYISGVNEERPAVISVNMFYASLAVNDFLARLHPYRDDPNGDYATLTFSLSQMRLCPEVDNEPCPFFGQYTGLGDQEIPLGLLELYDAHEKVS